MNFPTDHDPLWSSTVTRSSNPGHSPEILIVIDSWEGHTARAAESVAEGVEAGGGTARVVTADDATHDDLKDCDGLVMGSPVHQRTMSWPMKRFVDLTCEPAWFYDDCVGKAGAVFSTGGGHGEVGGGCELAQLSMLGNLAACGMVLVSHPKCTPGFGSTGMHWGPHLVTSDDQMRPIAPDDLPTDSLRAFVHHGSNIAKVALSLQSVDLARGAAWPDAKTIEQREQMMASGELNRPTC